MSKFIKVLQVFAVTAIASLSSQTMASAQTAAASGCPAHVLAALNRELPSDLGVNPADLSCGGQRELFLFLNTTRFTNSNRARNRVLAIFRREGLVDADLGSSCSDQMLDGVNLLLPGNLNVDPADLSCGARAEVYSLLTRSGFVSGGRLQRAILAVFRREGLIDTGRMEACSDQLLDAVNLLFPPDLSLDPADLSCSGRAEVYSIMTRRGFGTGGPLQPRVLAVFRREGLIR